MPSPKTAVYEYQGADDSLPSVVVQSFSFRNRAWYRLLSDGRLQGLLYHSTDLGWFDLRQVNPKGTAFRGLVHELQSRWQGPVPRPDQLDNTTPWCGCKVEGVLKCPHGRQSYQHLLRTRL